MRFAQNFLPLILAVALPGCDSVFVTDPVGEESVALDAELWQGTWVSGEIFLMTTVLDAGAGSLQAAWLERGEDGAKMEAFRGQVRRSGERLYISMLRSPPDDGEPGDAGTTEYLWARLENDGRTALVWWPSPEAVRTAVRTGRLPGIVKEDDDVRLGRLTPEQLEWISAPGSGMLGWEEPLVFVRVGD